MRRDIYKTLGAHEFAAAKNFFKETVLAGPTDPIMPPPANLLSAWRQKNVATAPKKSLVGGVLFIKTAIYKTGVVANV